jgi:hypothetical protein
MQWENTLAAAQIIDDNSTSGSKKYAGSERGLAGDHDPTFDLFATSNISLDVIHMME